jgi:CrcB protein
MLRLGIVCLGGALGSGARYLVALGAGRWLGPGFPWGTLAVNTAGSFLITLLVHLSVATQAVSPELRLFLTTGVMGGLTTYSTFNHETLQYLRDGAWLLGGANLVVTVVACLAAGLLGLAAGRALAA